MFIDMGRDQRLDKLASLASRQHGVFARSQARSIGFTRSAIDHRVRIGEWEVIDYGVYRAAGTPPSWRQRVLSACLSGPAVASHRASARLWRLPGFDDAAPEVAAWRYRRRSPTDIVWHESTRLDPDDLTEIDGIPVTKVTRTIVDLGAVCDEAALLAAFDDAVRRRLTNWESVAERLECFGSARLGSGTVRRVLARRSPNDPVAGSPLESGFDSFAHEHHLPVPTRQLEVRLSDGRRVRPDFAYPEVRLAIEIDSIRHHAGPDEWRSDVARQNELAALGWRVLRFTSDDLQRHGDRVERLTRRALAALNLPGHAEKRNKR